MVGVGSRADGEAADALSCSLEEVSAVTSTDDYEQFAVDATRLELWLHSRDGYYGAQIAIIVQNVQNMLML